MSLIFISVTLIKLGRDNKSFTIYLFLKSKSNLEIVRLTILIFCYRIIDENN